jgi:hypothetical protein
MAHTQRNEPRTPSAKHGENRAQDGRASQDMEDPTRGQHQRVTNSPRKRAPQAAAGKRHE